MELLGFVLLVIVWLLVVAGIRSWKTRAKYPPGPMALPFIGHYHLLGTPPLHQSFSKLAERYGPLMFLRFGSAPVVVASSPEAVAAIFKSNDVTFANRQLSAATERLSYGRRAVPFIPYGPDWAFIKKLIATHLLGSDRSERIHTQELHRLIRFLLEMSQSGQTVNFTWELLKMSRNNMCQMLIGKGLYLDLSTGDELEGLIREVIKLATDSHYSVSNICTFLKHLDLDGILKRVEDLFQRFDGFLEKVVTEREEVRKNRRAGDIAEEDFLEVMLNLMEDVNSNNPITREQIKALLLVQTLPYAKESFLNSHL